MATRWFALVCGVVYTLLGLLGWCPAVQWTPQFARDRMFDLHFGAGWILGMFPVNWPHNILWVLIGVAGLVCFTSFYASRIYARVLFLVTVAFTFIGLLPAGISTLWGFLPLESWNVMIHAWTAIMGWYCGWIYPLNAGERFAPVPAAAH